MKNYKFLALYNGLVVLVYKLVYKIDWRYFIENSKLQRKELKKSDFIFIA